MKNKRFGLACLSLLLTTVVASCVVVKDVDSAALSSALQSGDRSDAEKLRDEGRRPAEVLAYLGIDEGMTVMDLVAAGGYYTEVLSYAVGPDGTVYAQNIASVLKFNNGANDKAMTTRLAGNRLPNVKRWDREINDLGIEPGSLDAAITALNLHDVYNNSPEGAYEALLAVKATLKPGGVLGIVDHDGNPDADNSALHRMQKSQALELAAKLGFRVESSDVLSNDEDDRTQMVFAPGIRGKTDRFVLKLTKI